MGGTEAPNLIQSDGRQFTIKEHQISGEISGVEMLISPFLCGCKTVRDYLTNYCVSSYSNVTRDTRQILILLLYLRIYIHYTVHTNHTACLCE